MADASAVKGLVTALLGECTAALKQLDGPMTGLAAGTPRVQQHMPTADCDVHADRALALLPWLVLLY